MVIRLPTSSSAPPGYDVTQNAARNLAGGALVVEGGLITVPIPVTNTVVTTIGVGTANPPFNINATTPANLPIFVFGSTSTTPNFMPVTDIDPTTVVVNGVAFPNATLIEDPTTGNHNPAGIPDAIITISPRANLKLPNGVDIVTISGKMLPSSPLFGFTWTGTATVTVTGGSVGPIISGNTSAPRGPVTQITYVPFFGPNQYTPSLTDLSALNYQPIPLPVALAQFLPPPGFRQRIYSFNHPGKTVGPTLIGRGQNKRGASGINTLSSKVFDRSRFHAQKNYAWTHKSAKLGPRAGHHSDPDRTAEVRRQPGALSRHHAGRDEHGSEMASHWPPLVTTKPSSQASTAFGPADRGRGCGRRDRCAR